MTKLSLTTLIILSTCSEKKWSENHLQQTTQPNRNIENIKATMKKNKYSSGNKVKSSLEQYFNGKRKGQAVSKVKKKF